MRDGDGQREPGSAEGFMPAQVYACAHIRQLADLACAWRAAAPALTQT